MSLQPEFADYSAYALVYDAFKGDRSSNVDLLKQLIGTYAPSAKTVLELACGTGALMQGLAKQFDVSGLDASSAMLRVAKQKLPGAPLYHADMTNFRLRRTFDVLYCMHNSVNHLVELDDWDRLFEMAAAHLNSGGIFIFDVNPTERLDRLAQLPQTATQVGDDYVLAQVIKERTPGRYTWQVKTFLHRQGNAFSLHIAATKIGTYPYDKINALVSKQFVISDFFVLHYAEMPDDIGRAYYVVMKK